MPGSEEMMQEEFAGGMDCSRSERSSLEVALEPASRPLSVAVGLDMEEPALSDVARLELENPCSMNGTPPRIRTRQEVSRQCS